MSQPKVSKSSIFAIIAAGLTPAERAEWDYKTAVGLKMLLDITKSLDKTSK